MERYSLHVTVITVINYYSIKIGRHDPEMPIRRACRTQEFLLSLDGSVLLLKQIQIAQSPHITVSVPGNLIGGTNWSRRCHKISDAP